MTLYHGGLAPVSDPHIIKGERVGDFGMQGEVTQKNLGLFIPGKIAGVAALLAKDQNRSIMDCMRDFYASKACKLLEREETKYWHYSAPQLYSLTRLSCD